MKDIICVVSIIFAVVFNILEYKHKDEPLEFIFFCLGMLCLAPFFFI